MSPRRPTARRQYSPSRGTQTRIPAPTATKSSAATRRAAPPRKVEPTLASTRTLRSTTSRLASSVDIANGPDKENHPMVTRPYVSRANLLSSPTSSGISKKSHRKANALKPRNKRVPLRELTEHEIFLRDEAVIGDLRRRRVSGENYIVEGTGAVVEFESVLAHEQVTHNVTAPEDSNAVAGVEIETELAEPEIPDIPRQPIERIQVLRRSDSEDRLKASLESMIAASQSTQIDPKRPRTRAALANKSQHPAVRTSIASFGSPPAIADLHSAEASPVITRERVARDSSPITSPAKRYSGVSKVQASPSPLKVHRVGLGVKSANTTLVMKKVLAESSSKEKNKITVSRTTTDSKTKEKEKPTATATKKKVATTTAKEVKSVAARSKSSLKRAAGVVGPASSSSTARAGLAGIGRMR